MRVVIADGGKPKICDIKDELERYYEIIHTDTIDIVKRYFCGRICVNCVVDDNGLLRDNPQITTFDEHGGVLVGVVVITGIEDENGNLTDLTETQASEIVKAFTPFRSRYIARATYSPML